MDHQIIHPTKEQVRAYMAGREAAHRPPPPPAEIRRQLGWRLAPPVDTEPPPVQFYLFPSTCSQLTAQLVLDLILAPSRAFAAAGTVK